ncbi:hypothetical protein GM1_002_01480 [Gordonia malaquae NBRC 108250]|uniref:Uncharacterized protein n=1 Tax=Gordonia malaquae NBRC 108250 TaxID=1223542 RepID=M3UG19_GORML|nr:hypothetical protein GM1_002_01480 [Gordonia malaquae NBRC 108250]
MGRVDHVDTVDGQPAEVSSGERLGVDRVRLVDGERVEQLSATGQRQQFRQTEVLVVEHRDLRRLQTADHVGDGGGRVYVDDDRKRVDEQADDRFDAGKVGGASGHGLTERDGLRAGDSRQQHSPRELQDRRRGDAAPACELADLGGELLVEQDGPIPREVSRGGLPAGSDDSRVGRSREHWRPGREAVCLVGRREIGQVVAEVGSDAGGLGERATGGVERKHVGEHQRSRPAVEHDVVVGDDEVPAVGTVHQHEADERRMRQVERFHPLGGGQRLDALGATVDHGPRHVDGLGDHRCDGAARSPEVRRSQHRVAREQSARGVLQPLHVDVAAERDDGLRDVHVDGALIAACFGELGLEVKAVLQRSQRPDRRPRMTLRDMVEVGLRERGAGDVGRREADVAVGDRLGDRGQLGDPPVGEVGDGRLVEHRGRVGDLDGELATGGACAGSDRDVEDRRRRHASGDRGRQSWCGGVGQQIDCAVPRRLAGDIAEVIERHGRKRALRQLGVVPIAEHAVPDPVLGAGTQLLLDRLHRVNRVVGVRQTDGRDAGEPTDGP